MITLDSTDPTPPYEQVRAQIAIQITAGRLEAGRRLPSVRQLANDLHLAPGTIARAYRLLEESALVETSRSGGTRVLAGKAVDERVTAAVLELIESLGSEPVELSEVLAAITAHWRNGLPHDHSIDPADIELPPTRSMGLVRCHPPLA